MPDGSATRFFRCWKVDHCQMLSLEACSATHGKFVRHDSRGRHAPGPVGHHIVGSERRYSAANIVRRGVDPGGWLRAVGDGSSAGEPRPRNRTERARELIVARSWPGPPPPALRRPATAVSANVGLRPASRRQRRSPRLPQHGCSERPSLAAYAVRAADEGYALLAPSRLELATAVTHRRLGFEDTQLRQHYFPLAPMAQTPCH